MDLIGLGLVAAGVFLAFPLYSGWDAGAAGARLVDGLRLLFGQVAYAVPVALVLTGIVLVLRPVLPAVRPLRAGALCLLAALTLAFAAGTVGLGSGPHAVSWASAHLQARGGALGEALYAASSRALGDLGSHVLAVFLFLAGILLLTGASVAGVLRATGSGVADTTRVLRSATAPVLARGGEAAAEPPPVVLPPEPAAGELRVRAGDRPPSLDGAMRYPDLFAADGLPPEEQPEVSGAPEASAAPAPAQDEQAPAPKPARRRTQRAAPEPAPAGEYHLPDPALLRRSPAEHDRPDTVDQERVQHALIEALGHHGVEATIVGTVAGPHITRYELRLAPGTKMNKVGNLKDDIAYALAATDIRILAPIPGKQAVGVEVPNRRRRVVTLGDVYGEVPRDASPLTVFLGKDVSGKPVCADLAKMPHLLVAGTTGAGKSGCVNAMLSSILLRATPDQVRLVLVDPKQVELNHYEAIPHLLTPVITSPRMAANALQNLVREMEWRYGIMSVARTRSLVELNRHRVAEGDEPLPYILCVIDELADLMMVAPADVEDSVIRLAQKARAVGIHLVLATQSPRVDVITGMIKANVPSRIAFAVSSQTDSRVILDHNGAESLLGQGDMLFSPVGSSRLQRIQGAYIDEPQIAQLTEFWAAQGEPALREDLLEEVETPADAGSGGDGEFDPDEDPMLGEAIRLVVEMNTASTSMLQRRLRLGYTRAGRLIDMLERRGIISGYEGSKPRQVLIGESDLPRVLAALEEGSPGPEPTDVTLPEPTPTGPPADDAG
ncbi:MAG TPA: DNA translocase FtsK 4TM domain-containing protein [Solirubrobacteraceae bacterium]|nr:DNA translocase FtsK 4TM domain-containing protein [Solirubrobacteraceae bacterium]